MPRPKGCIFLFSVTETIARPWSDAGFLCYCVDIQHPSGETRKGNIILVGADIHHWWPPYGIDIVFVGAFPPCTDLAVSGARHFRKKGLARLIPALALFQRAVAIAEWTRAPYFIENPVSTISTYWRKPDHAFDPCDFGGYVDGDRYTKKTCLWTGNGFVMPPPKRIEPCEGNWVLRFGPGKERQNLRSATPRGFARAVFLANMKKPRAQKRQG